MQIPASNLRPDRFHRLVGNCRAEIDEVLPLAIFRSPRPKRVPQKIETFRSDMSFADHHPCNRQASSSPDEVPAHTPSNARLWLPEPPRLPSRSCNARWHHRRNAQTTTADTASPYTGQKHSAETDWLTEG